MALVKRPLLVVLRALGLGDLLTGVPALRALADAYPEHRRVLAAPAWLEPVARLSGAVHDVVPTAPLAPLGRRLAGADFGVNLHGRGPASHRVLLATRPRRLVAFGHPEIPESAGMPDWRADEHEVARWCRLLTESGIPADAGRLDLEAPRLPVADAFRGATLLHPGAASAARRWPPERFAAVARSELEAGRCVVVTGGRAEVELARVVARRAGLADSAVLAGRTGLLELAAVVGAAGRVVCGDTGIAHLATALRTPSVVLFGPTSPARWGPPPDRPWHRALWKGKMGDPHGAAPDAGLLELQVEDVLAALAEVDAPATEAAA
jgi:ADP-heptose:LPS heptosyltransferase